MDLLGSVTMLVILVTAVLGSPQRPRRSWRRRLWQRLQTRGFVLQRVWGCVGRRYLIVLGLQARPRAADLPQCIPADWLRVLHRGKSNAGVVDWVLVQRRDHPHQREHSATGQAHPIHGYLASRSRNIDDLTSMVDTRSHHRPSWTPHDGPRQFDWISTSTMRLTWQTQTVITSRPAASPVKTTQGS